MKTAAKPRRVFGFLRGLVDAFGGGAIAYGDTYVDATGEWVWLAFGLHSIVSFSRPAWLLSCVEIGYGFVTFALM